MLRAEDRSVLRATTIDDLSEYLGNRSAPETAWLGAAQQLEEAWFLGLRRNAGVAIQALRDEFGTQAVEPSVAVAHRLAEDGIGDVVGRQSERFDGEQGLALARGRRVGGDETGLMQVLAVQLEVHAPQRMRYQLLGE